MPSPVVYKLYRRTLGGVIFGVALMVLIAAYIAVGSGFPSLRGCFEMTDLQFFSAWPLKLLMALLIVNLTCVTLDRIPLTPPRYGVWCVHVGIVTLILGMGFYYDHKLEGLIRVPIGGSVDHFYDSAERAIYARIDGDPAGTQPLPSLPRFHEVDDASYFTAADFKRFRPTLLGRSAITNQVDSRPAAEVLGLKDDLRVDITGYWPYANIVTRFASDPASNDVGLRLSMAVPAATGAPAADVASPLVTDGHPVRDAAAAQALLADSTPKDLWLVAADPASKVQLAGSTELEQRLGDAGDAKLLRESADHLHKLTWAVGDQAGELFVNIAGVYPLGQTGYTVTVENFNPNWEMFGTHEVVKALTMRVTGPGHPRPFRRMVLEGKDVQTDFLIGVADAGPMGKRQKVPLDDHLKLGYQLNDPAHLLPVEGAMKHTLLTLAENRDVLDVTTGPMLPTAVHDFPAGTGSIDLLADDTAAPFAPFAGMATTQPAAMNHAAMTRDDHVRVTRSVAVVPPAKRQRDLADQGIFQVVRANVSVGDWSQTVLVPYADEAADNGGWDGPSVLIPGTTSRLQLQLSNRVEPMPARITLEKFELEPYPGGDLTRSSLFRDFKSSLRITDPDTGDWFEDVAHLNHPVYYRHGQYLFFQAQWDAQGAESGTGPQWTVLGVGNRPGVAMMTTGAVLIGVGLLYAFYAKPIILRRMKANALRNAAKRPKEPVPAALPADPSLVAVK